MSCKAVTLNSIDATCDKSIGGIRKVYIAPMDYVTDEFVYNDIVQSVGVWGADEKKPGLMEYVFRPGTSSYTATNTKDAVNNSVSCSTELVLQFSKADKDKRNEFNKLIGIPCFIIVQDNYGKYVVLEDALLTNGVMQSGTATSDLSGFTLTLTAESSHLPYFLNETLTVDGLKGGIDLVSNETTLLSWDDTIYGSTGEVNGKGNLAITNLAQYNINNNLVMAFSFGETLITIDLSKKLKGQLVFAADNTYTALTVELTDKTGNGAFGEYEVNSDNFHTLFINYSFNVGTDGALIDGTLEHYFTYLS